MTRAISAIVRGTLAAGLVLTVSCTPESASQTKPENKSTFDETEKMLKEAQGKREARLAQLKSMDVNQLSSELAQESAKGTEPFNSMAYAEAVSRGDGVASGLKPASTKADRSSLLALLALRKVSAAQYGQLDGQLRVSILTDALKTSRYFNNWGLPSGAWEDGAKAIIAEGRAAEPAMAALLRDTRPAPVWGSEGMMEYQKYRYRVCDYAWALVNEIRNQRVPIPPDAAERDKLIAATIKELGTAKNPR